MANNQEKAGNNQDVNEFIIPGEKGTVVAPMTEKQIETLDKDTGGFEDMEPAEDRGETQEELADNLDKAQEIGIGAFGDSERKAFIDRQNRNVGKFLLKSAA